MSSTAIVRALLKAHAPLLALIPETKLFVGVVPQATQLPAIGVSEISANEEQTISRGLSVSMIRARVQVTAYAKTYDAMKALIKAAKLGKGVHTGMVQIAAGKQYRLCSVLQWGTGPEIPPGDDGIFEQSRDFMVTFMEAN